MPIVAALVDDIFADFVHFYEFFGIRNLPPRSLTC